MVDGRQPQTVSYGVQLFRWRAAEDALYASAIYDVERYQRAVGLVGRVLNVLRQECLLPDELLAVAEDPVGLLCRAGVRLPADLDPVMVVHAACAVRAIELGVGSGEPARTPTTNS